MENADSEYKWSFARLLIEDVQSIYCKASDFPDVPYKHSTQTRVVRVSRR